MCKCESIAVFHLDIKENEEQIRKAHNKYQNGGMFLPQPSKGSDEHTFGHYSSKGSTWGEALNQATILCLPFGYCSYNARRD